MRLISLAALAFLVITITAIPFYGLSPRETLVFLNKEKIEGQFIRQLAELNAAEAQVRRTTRRFNSALNQVLNAYASRHHVIIIERKLMLAGGLDITDDITAEVSGLMRQQS
ncbi:TrbI F-type domain-containing protein [Legionella gresilensis]|uniref:TrbI F-type domain-containing protein n=1 Tax=Legionella gresilensis TaxID=91823 RepID=UPI0010413F97|nr:TrbI F-type domain-containing protein [Legionella gresilensis]